MAMSAGRLLLRLPREAVVPRLRSAAAVRTQRGWRAASSTAGGVTLVRQTRGVQLYRRGNGASRTKRGFVVGGRLAHNTQSARGLASGVDYTVVNMPALSPTMESGSVTQWHKQPGDELGAGDVICDVETDKATVAFDVQDDGVLAKIISAAGSGEVTVGGPVAIIVEDAAAYAAFVKADAAGGVQLGGAEAGVAAGATVPEEGPSVVASSESPANDDPARTVPLEFLYAPAARHMAQSKGIDASSLEGTGKGGRITKADLVTALAKGLVFPPTGTAAAAVVTASTPTPAAAPVAAAVPAAVAPAVAPAAVSSSSADFEDHQANNIKKITAKRLTQSKAEVPHLYVSMACEVDGLMAFRKTMLKEHDIKVSVNDIIIRSAALALRDVPEANAMWTNGARRSGESIDVSVAVATPTGLITPIVTGADRRGLSNISTKVRDLATRARDRQLKPEEFQGGSFTVSNLGMFGINEFSAVINMPQACILAVGGGAPTVKPGKVAGEKPRVCSEVTVRLSADRRVVDEAIAAQLLQSFKHYMETPELLLM